ncbi:MAG: amidase [Deltaproteobacteria bacterium]|jgi:aspartyl-tRNA(Asn)/glutamyl-tRNA(Gln) amidotransferase subunit A|nr:amidase [Deltaproteobacteria bacterium]
MTEKNLHYESITELANGIRKGEYTSTELTQYFLERIAALDDSLNAFQRLCPERALQQARAADEALRSGDQDPGLLHGIPYAVKDLFDVSGLPTTAGTKLLEDNIASEDSTAVRQLSTVGMILLGKTNTVQFAFSGVGINHDHGTPWNPWGREHYLPGGSSSGSGVAVAAGMVPMALGTDTGGSVRVPAALCGTVGLKTTVGRISRAGVYPLSWTFDSVGCLTRTVEDAAVVYQYMQGPDIDDESTLGIPTHDVMQALKEGVKGMRLAFAESVFQENLDREVERALRECGRVFEELGARVSSIEFDEAREALALNPGIVTIASEGYTLNKKLLEEKFDELDPVVANRMILGKDVPSDTYLQNSYKARQLRAAAGNTLKDIDALLVPTTPLPALPVSEVDTDFENYFNRNALYLRNTCIGNVLNMCGLSLPCGFTTEGLPIGLLIYGKPFQENAILRAGYAFQQSTDWHRQAPDLSWAVAG